MQNKNCLILWSGGKDSFWAYCEAKRLGYNVCGLLTYYLPTHNKTIYHNLKLDILEAQAKCIGVPIHFVPLRKLWFPTPSTYRFLNHFSFISNFITKLIVVLAKKPLPVLINILYGNERKHLKVLTDLKRQYNLSYVFSGNLPDKEYEIMSRSCDLSGMELISFLKNKKGRDKIITALIESQVKFVIVSADPYYIERKFVGKVVDHAFLEHLRKNHVDICGTNGEFHTLVIDAPDFKKKIEINNYEVITIREQNTLSVKGYNII